MQAVNKLFVIGVGYKPFDKKAHELILSSEVILASERLFEVFQGYEEFHAVKDKVIALNKINDTIEFIRKNLRTKRMVLLASGDPLFSGIGRRAVDEFGKDAVEIIPDLSSIQMAFSRIKEPWDDAFLISLHGGPDPAKRRRLPYEIQDIPFLLERHNKIAILTDRENNPTEIARVLALSHFAPSLLPILYVCERLGYEDEKITRGSPEEIAAMSFSDPNVVILLSSQSTAPIPKSSNITFGLMEDEISHSRGLITKDEVRAVTIHKLKLPEKGVLWDIGAGSGSISIEAARLFPGLKVFAIEKNKEQIANIRKNRTRFEASNVQIIEGIAPDALTELPSPDRVFIGGSGGSLQDIIRHVSGRNISGPPWTSGIIVVNITKIDTLHYALEGLTKAGYTTDISQISVSRTRAIGDGTYLSAQNPVFILRGEMRYNQL